jgi:phosphinothricin acetyltransferase
MIVPARAEHATGIAAVYQPYVSDTAVSLETSPPSVDEVRDRMSRGLPWFVALSGDEVVGFCSASPHKPRAGYRWSVDCSVYLRPDVLRRGLARDLYTALFDQLRELGYVQAFAAIALPNPASVGLHEAMGFTPVGVYRQVGFKLGRWHDVGWWQLQLQEPPAEPAPPRTWVP